MKIFTRIAGSRERRKKAETFLIGIHFREIVDLVRIRGEAARGGNYSGNMRRREDFLKDGNLVSLSKKVQIVFEKKHKYF